MEKKREMYPDKTLIPYLLYCDEVEINNPLGSHSSNLVSNFYANFLCLPEDTKLKNVFFIASITSRDFSTFGKKECLNHIINQMVILEVEGVPVQLSTGDTYHVHFIPL